MAESIILFHSDYSVFQICLTLCSWDGMSGQVRSSRHRENNTGIYSVYRIISPVSRYLIFFISHASRKQLKLVVMLGIVLYSVLPELFRRDIFVTKEGYSPIWMIVLYIIGGYLGKYQGWKKNQNDTLVLFISYA